MDFFFRDQNGKLRQYFYPSTEEETIVSIILMRNCVKEVAIKEGIIPKSAILALIRCR